MSSCFQTAKWQNRDNTTCPKSGFGKLCIIDRTRKLEPYLHVIKVNSRLTKNLRLKLKSFNAAEEMIGKNMLTHWKEQVFAGQNNEGTANIGDKSKRAYNLEPSS